jgi:hypothetical protein
MPGKRQAGWPSLWFTFLLATQEKSDSAAGGGRKPAAGGQAAQIIRLSRRHTRRHIKRRQSAIPRAPKPSPQSSSPTGRGGMVAEDAKI